MGLTVQLNCARRCEPRRQNGHKRAFSRSRRAAGFLLHTFLSPSKEKCERPIGRQVPLPRRSRRVILHPGKGVCSRGLTKGLSARPLETFGHRSWREPRGTPNPTPQPESTHQAPSSESSYGIVVVHRCRQGAFFGANNRRGPHCRALRLLFA